RMRGVSGAKRALRFLLLVVGVYVGGLEHRERAAGLVGERDAVAARRLVHRQAHRQRPREPGTEPHRFENGGVVLAAHKPLERRERAACEQVEVGELAGSQCQRLEALDALGTCARAIDELAAVRRDQLRLGRDTHDRTSPCNRLLLGISSRASSTSRMRCALSPGSSCSDSIRISGSVGASYGSDTPVNSGISPRNAFSYSPFTSRRAHSSTDASTKTSTKVPCSSIIVRAS